MTGIGSLGKFTEHLIGGIGSRLDTDFRRRGCQIGSAVHFHFNGVYLIDRNPFLIQDHIDIHLPGNIMQSLGIVVKFNADFPAACRRSSRWPADNLSRCNLRSVLIRKIKGQRIRSGRCHVQFFGDIDIKIIPVMNNLVNMPVHN